MRFQGLGVRFRGYRVVGPREWGSVVRVWAVQACDTSNPPSGLDQIEDFFSDFLAGRGEFASARREIVQIPGLDLVQH